MYYYPHPFYFLCLKSCNVTGTNASFGLVLHPNSPFIRSFNSSDSLCAPVAVCPPMTIE